MAINSTLTGLQWPCISGAVGPVGEEAKPCVESTLVYNKELVHDNEYRAHALSLPLCSLALFPSGSYVGKCAVRA